MKYSELIEAPTKIKDKVNLDDLKVATSKGELSTSNNKISNTSTKSNQIPGRQAVPGEIKNVRIPANNDAINALMGQDFDSDEVSDKDALKHAGLDDKPKLPSMDTKQNQLIPINKLPAIIKNDTGNNVNIVWHPIPTLPNYAVNKIRAAFRPLFNNFLKTPLEKISVATELPGTGTDPRSLNSLWNFLLAKGNVDDTFQLDAFGIDPRQYHIEDSHVVSFAGHKFLLLDERHPAMGQEIKYIYVAPGAAEDKTISNKRQDPKLIS